VASCIATETTPSEAQTIGYSRRSCQPTSSSTHPTGSASLHLHQHQRHARQGRDHFPRYQRPGTLPSRIISRKCHADTHRATTTTLAPTRAVTPGTITPSMSVVSLPVYPPIPAPQKKYETLTPDSQDGSYYYANTNGSTYHNDGTILDALCLWD
jgi:hypothetical protein